DELPNNSRIPGVSFRGRARISPDVPVGALQFVQLVNIDRRITFTDQSALVRTTNSQYVLDTSDPYGIDCQPMAAFGACSSPQQDIFEITANDSPSQPSAESQSTVINNVQQITAKDSFKLFFMYAPQLTTRYTLGTADWSWI